MLDSVTGKIAWYSQPLKVPFLNTNLESSLGLTATHAIKRFPNFGSEILCGFLFDRSVFELRSSSGFALMENNCKV